MPLILYKCENNDCKNQFSVFVGRASDISSKSECKKCGGGAKRVFGAPAVSSKLTVDNGAASKAVEIYPDQVEVFKDHNKKGQNRGD